MNPFLQSVFSMTAPCLPCCGGPPAECPCALVIPFLDPLPYTDYSTAEAAIADIVVDCYGVLASVEGTVVSPVVDVSNANEVSIAGGATDPDQSGLTIAVAVTLSAGSTLDVTYSVSASGTPEPDEETLAGVIIRNQLGSIVFSDSDSAAGAASLSGTFTFGPFDEACLYYVICAAAAPAVDPGTGSSITASFDIVCDDTMVPNPVIAAWDDSGTTRYLEACPKLLAPYGTEQSGDWFADESAAQDFLDSLSGDYIANCLGIVTPSWSGLSVDSVAATGGSTPEISASISTPSQADSATIELRRGIMIEGGDTITVPISLIGSYPAGGLDVRYILSVIDPDTGSVEFTDTSTVPGDTLSASPSFTAPWSGKFYLTCNCRFRMNAPSGDPASFDASMGASSSGTMSGDVPIQALYSADPVLECPARLDCTP